MTQVTEIERAAVTLLAVHRNEVIDEVVDRWIHRLLTEPEFANADNIIKHRSNVSGNRYVDWADIEDADYRRYAKGMNDAVIDLGLAICHYRHDGHPIGDQEHRLSGLGGHVVVTSLAATVVEFHQHVLNAHAAL